VSDKVTTYIFIYAVRKLGAEDRSQDKPNAKAKVSEASDSSFEMICLAEEAGKSGEHEIENAIHTATQSEWVPIKDINTTDLQSHIKAENKANKASE